MLLLHCAPIMHGMHLGGRASPGQTLPGSHGRTVCRLLPAPSRFHSLPGPTPSCPVVPVSPLPLTFFHRVPKGRLRGYVHSIPYGGKIPLDPLLSQPGSTKSPARPSPRGTFDTCKPYIPYHQAPSVVLLSPGSRQVIARRRPGMHKYHYTITLGHFSDGSCPSVCQARGAHTHGD